MYVIFMDGVLLDSGERHFRHKNRISMLAALCDGKVIASAIFSGYCDGDVFELYVI